MIKKIGSILVLVSLFSCHGNAYDFEREKLVIDNQQFEILTANEIFSNFITNKSNYSQYVFKNIEDEFKQNAEYPFMLETLKKEMKPGENLKEQLEMLHDIDFLQIAASAFKRIIKELPGPKETKILFIPVNPEYKDLYRQYKVGMGGITVGTGKIIISIDPTSNYWEEQLPYVIAHEYHHSVWTSRNFTTVDFTPLEYLVLEGKADSFARNLFPDTDMPHIIMVDKDKERYVWSLIKSELNNRKSEMNDLMMVGNRDIPKGSGYVIGFNMAELYKRNNQKVHDSILIDIEPKQILSLSKYDKLR